MFIAAFLLMKNAKLHCFGYKETGVAFIFSERARKNWVVGDFFLIYDLCHADGVGLRCVFTLHAASLHRSVPTFCPLPPVCYPFCYLPKIRNLYRINAI